ncbi:siderophore-interacting protein [Altericroceibacterium spongiae]|uniref:Siderophore-interacting protein n=1 Tax=Altericroceibacterium spongiae TaxID=2320269 RepID=A0A420ECB0_9SPHN|nr:siderophore-interacting protein [Altericroceibacterium spongiae]RKF18316.1 siderophore-interacting protein [Altericroceibacterium spongiae]
MPKRRPAPRELKVRGSQQITPNMLRITVGGEGLAGFPESQDGGYVKLMLNPTEGSSKPIVRTYTIRAQRPDELDIDFVMHDVEGHAGPATEWALNASPGETIMVGGPGPAKPLPSGFDNYVITGDMSALPAISVNLENLPASATGIALLEIQHEDDRQAIDHPEGVAIHWIVNPRPGEEPNLLLNTLKKQDWPAGSVYAWTASEFATMRGLRNYFMEEHGLTREAIYFSSYWKKGSNEDSHKDIKRQYMESVGAVL